MCRFPCRHCRCPGLRTRRAPSRLKSCRQRRWWRKDGTYTGPVTDAYYGNMQVQADIQGGQLASVKVLQYPSDRRTSRRINSVALPMLAQEAISAQSASVDTVSGATLSSRAYAKSLAGALKQAASGQTNL
jgi:uncharacterized protein with FMN-binding domain